MINSILTGWSFVRTLRLVIGVSALAAYFSEHESFMGLLGLIVIAQAVFNVGCCGVCDACEIIACFSGVTADAKKIQHNSKEISSDKTEVSFEEIK